MLAHPSTEADTERFFRVYSLEVDIPYMTNMSSQKASYIAFARYYAREIYYYMGKGKDCNENIIKITLKAYMN